MTTMKHELRTDTRSGLRPIGGRPRYCIISPCRDEAAFMQRTLDSVLAQTAPPALWVIVDDGSTDASPHILDRYAARHDVIRVVRREDRGRRSVGPGVIDAFYAGLDTVDLRQFDFICKLDLDLDLPPRYFELLMRRMQDNPRLGTCSGKAYYADARSGEPVSEGVSDEMSVGASKFYRRECFEQIGGFVRQVMWDGIDCHRCRMLGWQAGSYDEPDLRFIHLRPMGSSEGSLLRGRMRHGRGQRFMGTSLAYMTASAAYRMMKPPLLLGGLAMWWGFVTAAIRRQPRYDDRAFRRFLRRYQRACLLMGKRRATRAFERRFARRWRADDAIWRRLDDPTIKLA